MQTAQDHTEIAEEDGRIAARMFGLAETCTLPSWFNGDAAAAWRFGYENERSLMAARVARATLA